MTKSGEHIRHYFLKSKSTILIVCSETETTYIDSSKNEEVILTRVVHGLQPCNTSSFCLDPDLPASLDTFTHEEFTSNTAGYFQVENEVFEIEN